VVLQSQDCSDDVPPSTGLPPSPKGNSD